MGNVLDAIAGAVARVNPAAAGSRRDDRTAHLATRWTLDSVIAAVVESITRRTSTDEGLADVWTLVGDGPTASTDMARPEVRTQITDWLLGSERESVEDLLCREVGVHRASLAALLESVVGVYLTHLRRRVALEGLSRAGLRGAIGAERDQTAEAFSVDLTERTPSPSCA